MRSLGLDEHGEETMRADQWAKPLTVLCVGMVILARAQDAFAACGSKGGPGYRAPNGRCVAWAEIGRICGKPPTTRCTAEIAHENAPDAADHGDKIEKLRPKLPPTGQLKH